MKRKRNHSLRSSVFIFLAALFLLFTCSVSTIYASTLQKPDIAASGKFVKDGDYWIYRYDDKTIAKNVFLKIDKKTYYFNKLGHRWCSWHTIKGKNYYFGTRSQGYLIKNSLIKYKGNYYYVGKDGAMVTGWYTDKSGKKYYFGKDGKAVTGKHKIKGTYYYFNQNGTVTHTGLNYSLSSDCALLMNADTGQIIYGKNENVAHANASTTKIMTCILALENCKLNEKVKFSPYAASIEPSKLYANAGEIFYLKDLLYSLMLPSHNDTAVAIAEHVSGSTAKFVKLMNKKAAEIGCTNTHFATPNGLDAGYNHYTTASDLAKIAQYAIKKPMFRKLVSTGYYSFSNLNTGRSYSIGTTNALRVGGPKVAALTLAFDLLKGMVCVIVFRDVVYAGSSWSASSTVSYPLLIALVALACLYGHIFSPYLKFHGGKGIATGVGILFGFYWPLALIHLAIFIVLVAITRYVSVGSIVTAALVPFTVFLTQPGIPLPALAVWAILGWSVVFAHRGNIARLRAGTENKLSFGSKKGER